MPLFVEISTLESSVEFEWVIGLIGNLIHETTRFLFSSINLELLNMLVLKIYLNQLWIDFVVNLGNFLYLLYTSWWSSWMYPIRKHEGAERPWLKVSVELGLCCHRVGCTLYILCINLKYTRHMLSTMYIPSINYVYTLYMYCISYQYTRICMVYTMWYIPCIFLVYDWYITSWPVYTWCILGRYIAYFMYMQTSYIYLWYT